MNSQSDAEFIALLQDLAGYTATNSLVCIAMHGLHCYGDFRLDLPQRKRTADCRELALEVIGILSDMNHIDRVGIVIYTDETFAAHHGLPWLEFYTAFAERVHKQGFHFAGFFCVAPDGWADYFDRNYPRQGRELSEIPNGPLPVAT